MNRRGFLFGLGATVAAAVAPVKALARTITLPRLAPFSTPIGDKLTTFSREISRDYIREHLFCPYGHIYNGVIIREEQQLELFPGVATGMRTMGCELPGVTEWIDEDGYDDEEDYD